MRMLILCVVVLAAAAAAQWRNGRPRGGFLNGPLHVLDSRAHATKYPGQTLTNFSQKFDHFDTLDQRRWSQRMYYNPVHADSAKNSGQDLIFLMIGGEGRESAKWSGDDSVMIMQYAAQYGAVVFDLEHRFFGDSRPINNMETSSLRLLTTQQALADLAYFITCMNKQYGYRNPKWITFGGSYPGSLSAMFRSKYPELTVGAVASSAPLNLALDFYQYADVVESVLKQTPIENKNKLRCDELVRQAFDRMHQLSLTAAGRQELNRKLKLNPPFDATTTKADINNLFANLYDLHQGMIQYTYDGSSERTQKYTTAAQMCRIYNQDKDLIENVWDLAQFSTLHQSNVNITSFDNSYADAIKDLAETRYDLKDGEDGNEMRGWLWLCCNEIGFLQTTDSDSIFGSTLPMNYFYDMCTDLFGPTINATFARDNNRDAQNYYGGEDYFEATNLCLPNGKFDPWSSLGYYGADESRNIVPVVIEGAAHCSDMYPPYAGEPAGLPAARQQIQAFLEGIIYDADHPKKSTASLTVSVLILSVVVRLF